MQMSPSQSSHFTSRESAPLIHCIGDWVGHVCALEAVKNSRICTCLYSNCTAFVVQFIHMLRDSVLFWRVLSCKWCLYCNADHKKTQKKWSGWPWYWKYGLCLIYCYMWIFCFDLFFSDAQQIIQILCVLLLTSVLLGERSSQNTVFFNIRQDFFFTVHQKIMGCMIITHKYALCTYFLRNWKLWWTVIKWHICIPKLRA